jgi:hypothetical protein
MNKKTNPTRNKKLPSPALPFIARKPIIIEYIGNQLLTHYP